MGNQLNELEGGKVNKTPIPSVDQLCCLHVAESNGDYTLTIQSL